jgi:hypothetical protein
VGWQVRECQTIIHGEIGAGGLENSGLEDDVVFRESHEHRGRRDPMEKTRVYE